MELARQGQQEEQIGALVTDKQHIDIEYIRKQFEYTGENCAQVGWLGSEYRNVREQVLELLELVENSGFLRDVEKARTEAEQQDPEEVLPSIA